MPVGTRTGWIMRQYHARSNREVATCVQVPAFDIPFERKCNSGRDPISNSAKVKKYMICDLSTFSDYIKNSVIYYLFFSLKTKQKAKMLDCAFLICRRTFHCVDSYGKLRKGLTPLDQIILPLHVLIFSHWYLTYVDFAYFIIGIRIKFHCKLLLLTQHWSCQMINIKEEREADGQVSVNVSPDSFIELKDLMSSDGEISELYDFSDRDFLEFNDILTSDTASTSSENSEYFNIGDMLREIARDGPMSGEEEKDDCVSSFTGPVQYDQADRDKQLKDKDSISWHKNASTPNHHLSNGSYLELRDLLPSNMASTKSGNLGSMRNNSCEYFNAHELLRDIARVDNAPVIGSGNC